MREDQLLVVVIVVVVSRRGAGAEHSISGENTSLWAWRSLLVADSRHRRGSWTCERRVPLLLSSATCDPTSSLGSRKLLPAVLLALVLVDVVLGGHEQFRDVGSALSHLQQMTDSTDTTSPRPAILPPVSLLRGWLPRCDVQAYNCEAVDSSNSGT